MNPWDQQPNESTKAFQRFAQYRDMGAGRSLRKLAKDLELNVTVRSSTCCYLLLRDIFPSMRQ